MLESLHPLGCFEHREHEMMRAWRQLIELRLMIV